MIKNSELHSLKNLERFKNVKKHQKLWITTNINSKLKIEIGIALTINTVSYTHLDVYKRQPYYRLAERLHYLLLFHLKKQKQYSTCLLYTSLVDFEYY